MNKSELLDPGTKHILRLIQRDKDAEGWTKVSRTLWPWILKLPIELVETQAREEGGVAKLTERGNIVIEWI